MIRASWMVAIASALIAGCGGDTSCGDACNCAARLNASPNSVLGAGYTSVESCVSRCDSGTCTNKQKTIDCTAAVACNTAEQLTRDALACFTDNGCSP